MNKVITIRLGNYVLTIDDDAAAVVSNYTEALRRKYATEEGAHEIVSDIEERMGELLDKKQKENHLNYSTLADVNAVIAQMGPLESNSGEHLENESGEIRRRLYRDPENRILGGVWGGIAAYFDIDPVILRIGWVLSVFLLGFGIPLYIILWVVIPEANTTAEKLMMRGRRPTLKNIEDNVKSELNDVGERFGNPKTHDRISDFLRTMVDYTGRFIGVVARFAFSVAGAIMLMILVAILIATTTNQIHYSSYHVILNGQEGLNVLLSSAGDPLWIKVAAVSFLLLLISWIGLFVFTNNKNRQRTRMPRRYLGWASTVSFLILFVFAFDGIRNIGTRSDRMAYTEVLNVSSDTLTINATVVNTDEKGLFTLNSFDDIAVSSDDQYHIEQVNTTFGQNRLSSTVRNEYMPKMYTINGNTITLLQGNKVKNLKNGGIGWVKYRLYVPAGKTVKSGSDFHFIENNHTVLTARNQQFTMDSTGSVSGLNGLGNGILLEKHIQSISIDGKFDVQIIPATTNRIELISGPVTMHKEWLDLDGSNLNIEEDENWMNEKPSYIRIYLNYLSDLNLESVSRVTLRDWKSTNLNIVCDDASQLEGNVHLSGLELEVNGSAKAELSGEANILNISASGAADFEGKALRSSNITANSSGASKVYVWATDNIDGEASGASTIHVKGNPKRATIETSGASTFKKI